MEGFESCACARGKTNTVSGYCNICLRGEREREKKEERREDVEGNEGVGGGGRYRPMQATSVLHCDCVCSPSVPTLPHPFPLSKHTLPYPFPRAWGSKPRAERPWGSAAVASKGSAGVRVPMGGDRKGGTVGKEGVEGKGQ